MVDLRDLVSYASPRFPRSTCRLGNNNPRFLPLSTVHVRDSYDYLYYGDLRRREEPMRTRRSTYLL